MSPDDNEDAWEKGCALIQAHLGVDPEVLDMDDWARLYARALWLEDFRLRKQAELMRRLFATS